VLGPPAFEQSDDDGHKLIFGPIDSLNLSTKKRIVCKSAYYYPYWSDVRFENDRVTAVYSSALFSSKKNFLLEHAVAREIIQHFAPRVALEDYPIQKELPDPLLRPSGRQVKTQQHWPNRREAILEEIMELQYGRTPELAGAENIARYHTPHGEIIVERITFDGQAKHTELILHLVTRNNLKVPLHLYSPTDSTGPFPVIVRFGLGDEHARAAIERGYAFACFDPTALDPDTEGYDEDGPAQTAFHEADWGSLAVWAWGATYIMNYLERRDDIDTTRSVITGHSRSGKAALLAGALDERWAIVAPNGSGAGGAATYRGAGIGNETLDLITREDRFKSWFHEDFGRFRNDIDRLPFDQHFMRALIAPRVVLSTDAYADQWAHPQGVQSAWLGAQPVFDLLGTPDHNLIHFRQGGHDQLPEDFEVLLNVADAHFQNQSFPEKLRTPPFQN
jgi:hypothetical protein